MMEIFNQPFMQRAFLAALISGFLLPLMGNYLIPKKLSLLGDASSHVAFAAIAVSVLIGYTDNLLLYLAPAAAIYAILLMINRFQISGDQALAILLAAGASVASVAISLGARINLNAVLFGSLLFVSFEDVLAGLIVSSLSAAFVFMNFGKTIIYTLSEELARIRGINIGAYTLVFSILAGVAVVSGIKIAGVLLVTALLAIPTTAASMLASSFKKAVMLSVLYGVFSTTSGIAVSYMLGVAPGAASVFILLIILGASVALKRVRIRI